MLFTFITIPTDFASSTLAGVSGPLVTDLLPIIATVLGVLLAVIVVVLLIRALQH